MTNKKIDLKWTPFALGCLDEIYDYIAYREKSEGPAVKLINTIFEKVDQLKKFPESGQPETLLKKIGQDSRYLVVATYKIIYEYHSSQNMVIVTDIFHTKLNPGKIKRTTE